MTLTTLVYGLQFLGIILIYFGAVFWFKSQWEYKAKEKDRSGVSKRLFIYLEITGFLLILVVIIIRMIFL